MDEKQSRIARDARGPRTTFEEIKVGENLGAIEWIVTREQVQALCESDDDYHEWYSVESPYSGLIAPVLMSYPPVRLLFCRFYNVRGLFYKLDLESLNPIVVGHPMIVTGRVIDKWIKRDREFVAYEGQCTEKDGLEVFRTRRAHVLDYIPRTAVRDGEAPDSGAASVTARSVPPPSRTGHAEERSEQSAPPPARREDEQSDISRAPSFSLVNPQTPIGWLLPPVSRQMSLQQFRDRHRSVYGENVWPEYNIHSDSAAARREGLSSPVASAPTIFALVTRMMMTTFGDGWIRGGKLSVKMIKPVYAEDFVTAKGRVIGKHEDAVRARYDCEAWVENQKGEKVVVGTASARGASR